MIDMTRAKTILAVILLVFFAACSALAYDIAAVVEDTEAGGRFDVYHWWTAGGEKEAIDTAIAVFESRYPNLEVVSNAVPGGAGGSMVMKVQVLALTGNSPESFQAHPGLEIEPYDDAGMLYDLTDLWEYAGLSGRIHPAWRSFPSLTADNSCLFPSGYTRTMSSGTTCICLRSTMLKFQNSP